MLLEQLLPKLELINGCTFASLDAETKSGSIRKVAKNVVVMLFTNKKSSGYENMVKRRLEAIGKDPDSFVLGDLRWGTRKPDSPLISHNGHWYLQVIVLRSGDEEYYLGFNKLSLEDAHARLRTPRNYDQGLPEGKEVQTRIYALENITAIRLLGDEVISEFRPRKRLSIKT